MEAYTLPNSVEDKIRILEKLSPEQYVAKLKEISLDSEVKAVFDAIK